VTAQSEPTITNESPENQTTDVSIQPKCNVTVTDDDGNDMDVLFSSNYTGSWVSYQSNYSVNNESVSWQFTGASTYNKKYWWSVHCNDGVVNVSKTYHFKTETQNMSPTISNPEPENESNDVSINIHTWNVTIEEPEGHTFNWTINVINSSTGYLIGRNSSNVATNGSKFVNFSGKLDYGITYYVYVNTTDFGNWTNESFWFTTESESVPIIYTTLTFGGKCEVQDSPSQNPNVTSQYPVNESTDQDMYPLLNVTVEDPQGNTMNISWSTNASGEWIYYNSTVSNGTYSQRATFANVSNTKYWWTVRVNDTENHWDNETFWFQTATYTWTNWSDWWTFNYSCEGPTDLSATAYNKTSINLTWTNAEDGCDANVLVRNETGWGSATYPLTPYNGTEIYNGTLHMFNDTGLKSSTTYYYALWGWNDTENEFSLVNYTDSVTTNGDIEIFETSVYPANESTEVERPATNMSIIINGTNLDVYFYFTNYTDTSNLTEVFKSWTGENTQRFEFTDFGWTPRTDWMWGNTKYYWSVNVTDGSTWLNRSFNYMSVASASGKNARYDVQLPLGVLSSADAIKTWASVPATYNRVYDVQVPHGVLSSADAQKVWNEVSS